MASSTNDFIAGAVSGGLGVLVGSPLDVIKVRLQTAPAVGVPQLELATSAGPLATRPSTWTLVKSLVHGEGVSSLFRGIASPVLSVAAMNSMLFVSYSQSLALLQHLRGPPPTIETTSSGGGRNGERSLTDIALAGTAAGFACFLISTPTELIKCRAQIIRSGTGTTTPPGFSTANIATPPASALRVPLTAPWRITTRPATGRAWTVPAHSSFAVAATVARTSGLAGFYRGGLVTLARDGPGYAVYFVGYEAVKRGLAAPLARVLPQAEESTRDRAAQFLAGGAAGVLSWASIYPLDVVKSRIQVSEPAVGSHRTGLVMGAAREAAGVSRDMWRAEGWRVFVRGMQPTLLRAFFVNAVTFATYEMCWDALEGNGGGQ
ncbi:hypothetical protein H9P43_005616 [Blastocladiella emersonii ATCC 22665]|nr:hypothetical protein H9P43_005616 [Blastocladiella emersonii ATCC 22665]